ncbi:MAG: hypothetical protein KME52_04845 [Desmonostoc geniculatum HA4340-LM1]|jgi:hypothetical protein|nr:hypothetical protein [Desmonostoc geniculatum HA4340-LM1]
MSSSSTISNLQQALNCAGKCDCCSSLQSQINQLKAQIAGLKPIDENRIIQSTRSALQPDIATAVAAGGAVIVNRLQPQIDSGLQKAKEALSKVFAVETTANNAQSQALKATNETVKSQRDAAEAFRKATSAEGTANNASKTADTASSQAYSATSTATKASSEASAASRAAEVAELKAKVAQARADNAYSVADVAAGAAEGATQKARSAEELAEIARRNANNAINTANSSDSAAKAAQKFAKTASDNAELAKGIANQADFKAGRMKMLPLRTTKQHKQNCKRKRHSAQQQKPNLSVSKQNLLQVTHSAKQVQH